MNIDSFPLPDLKLPALQPFWAAAARRRLELPRCVNCQQFNWYPAEQCRHCQHTFFNWVDVPPHGTLFSWSVVQRPLFAPYAVIAPYIPAVIELSAAPGVRLVTRIVDADPHLLTIDAAVDIMFADLTYPHSHSHVIAPLAKLARAAATC